jgi:RimJ/RimL family protein N-acetyltransferase
MPTDDGHATDIPSLETERLILRPLMLEDAAATQRLFPHWEIVRYLSGVVPWPYPPDGARTFYRDVALPAMAAGQAWHWTLRLREAPDEMIGVISLKRDGDNNRGFWIGLPWQGRGYASEACAAVTRFWFETLGFDSLIVPKAIDNIASRRISERTGMTVLRTEPRPFVSGVLPAEVWQLTREEWLSQQTR